MIADEFAQVALAGDEADDRAPGRPAAVASTSLVSFCDSAWTKSRSPMFEASHRISSSRKRTMPS